MIKMKKLLSEGVDHKYTLEFQDYLETKYRGKKINGWELGVDQMAGTFYWESRKGGNIIMATPFWEDEPKLPVNILDADGAELMDTSYPFKPSGDFKKDEATYFKLLRPIFKSMR